MLTIHKASAGSGKTYNLALKYLTLLLGVKDRETGQYRLNTADCATKSPRQPNRHRHILAITFTNKATDEMKKRIVDELDKLCGLEAGDDNSYARTLMATFGCTARPLRDAARQALNELLTDYSKFNVSTIDSFFQSVLRNFAREIDRQGDYEIEIDESYAISEALAAMLDKFNLNPDHPDVKPVKRWISEYISNAASRGEQTNIFNQKSTVLGKLVKFVGDLFDERFNRYSKDLMLWLEDPKRIGNFKKALAEYLDKADSILSEDAKAFAEFCDMRGLSVKAPAKGIIERTIAGQPHQGKNFTDKFVEAIYDEPFSAAPFFKKGDVDKAGLSADDTAYIRKTLLDITEAHSEKAVAKKIADSINTIELLKIITSYIKAICHENNIMLLADTNALLDKIIGAEEFPFVYERMGVELQNFLIDEFQDTSRMQWHNLKPLVDTALRDRYDSLIIGDVKQAIYRFRNSDSSMLASSVESEDFPGLCEVRGDKVSENTNWRSAPDIVRFNNTLFTILSHNLQVAGYEGIVQQISPKTRQLRGYVRMIPSGTEADASYLSAAQTYIDRYFGEGYKPIFPSQAEKNKIVPLTITLGEILRQRAAGYPWKSIAVLVNTNREANEFVSFLLANSLPVLSDEGLLLANSRAVRTIVALMTLIEKSNHITTPTPDGEPVNASADDVRIMMCRFEYFMMHSGSIDKALELALDPQSSADIDPAVIESYGSEALINDITEQNPANLSSLVETIIARRITPSTLAEETAFIAAFEDIVALYAAHFDNSLGSFLRYWNSKCKSAAISSPPKSDSITVMTIHKSKGLEFDCVHIPFGSWSVSGKEEDIWVETPRLKHLKASDYPPAVRVKTSSELLFRASPLRTEAEENLRERRADILNKTYVAYTRAVRELCVVYRPNYEMGKEIACALDSGMPPSAVSDPSLTIDFTSASRPNPDELETGMPTSPAKKADKTDIQASPMTLKPIYKLHPDGLIHSLLCVDTLGDEIGDDSDTDDQELTDSDKYDNPEARNRGNALHMAFSLIEKDLSAEVIAHAVEVACARHGVDDRGAAEYRELIARTLADKEMAGYTERWFVAPSQVRNEASVFVPRKNMFDEFDEGGTRRIDRLMLYDDGTIDIVDYKFTSDTDDSYHAQVQEYIDLIRNIFPDREVRGYLWYVDLRRVERVG